jgi:acetoin utilization deacetylase AcuC-like enzyme
MYASSHQSPLYPDTGQPGDVGVGNLANVPLAPGTGSESFRHAWRENLLPRIDAFRPQLVLVSAGFDGHRLDPLADLVLEAADYRWLSTELAALSRRHAEGRLVSLLEGGYSLSALRACSVAHLEGLLA